MPRMVSPLFGHVMRGPVGSDAERGSRWRASEASEAPPGPVFGIPHGLQEPAALVEHDFRHPPVPRRAQPSGFLRRQSDSHALASVPVSSNRWEAAPELDLA